MLTDDQIKKFQQIHKEYFGTEISREEAYKSGSALIRLMQLIYKPVPKSQNSHTDSVGYYQQDQFFTNDIKSSEC